MERICGSQNESWPVTSRQRHTKPDVNTLHCPVSLYGDTVGLRIFLMTFSGFPPGLTSAGFEDPTDVCVEEQKSNLDLKTLKFRLTLLICVTLTPAAFWVYFHSRSLSQQSPVSQLDRPVHLLKVSDEKDEDSPTHRSTSQKFKEEHGILQRSQSSRRR